MYGGSWELEGASTSTNPFGKLILPDPRDDGYVRGYETFGSNLNCNVDAPQSEVTKPVVVPAKTSDDVVTSM